MFQMRKGQIMWFLGAGASRAAGIKTAGDMIWEFKRNLYCSEKKQALSVVSDLGDPVVRRKLQAHFDANGGYLKMSTRLILKRRFLRRRTDEPMSTAK
jgi:hypothetical protein